MESTATNKTRSSGGVVLNKDGKVLVVSQRGLSWSLPKGHIENEEDELMAARREITEESGVTDLALIKKLGSYERYRMGKDGGEDKTESKQITLFLFKTSEIKLKPIDPDNPEARWVDKNEVANLLSHQKDKDFFLSIIPSI